MLCDNQDGSLACTLMLQRLAEAFKENNLVDAERVITDLRYVIRTGEAIAKKVP